MLVAGRSFPVSALLFAVTSLRPVRALLLDFGYRRTLQGIAAGLEQLHLYTRLTALHLNFAGAYSRTTAKVQTATQAALDSALDAIASRPTSLTSLAIHCFSWRPDRADIVRPTAAVLRRLCPSVQHLSLNVNELLLMAWGSDAPAVSSSDGVWMAQSVRSLVFPTLDSLSYLQNDRAVATITAALPSVTHLAIQCPRPCANVSALLQPIGSRLVFFSCATTQLLRFAPVGATLTALKSLRVIDSIWRRDDQVTAVQLSEAFTSLINCPALSELTVLATNKLTFPVRALFLAPLQQLTFFHIRTNQLLNDDEMQQLCSTLLSSTPNLTHLSLALHESQVVKLLQAIGVQLRLPQLTRCFIGRILTASTQRSSLVYRAERRKLKQQLGSAWCERPVDVMHWRADRVWQRSVGLPYGSELYL